MEVLRHAQRAGCSRGLWGACVRQLSQATEAVPAGHHNSDLSSTACHIGLNRRRDITLRGDLTVELDGKRATLAEVFKVSSGFSALSLATPRPRACGVRIP